jgi:signal transduction histidine kinase
MHNRAKSLAVAGFAMLLPVTGQESAQPPITRVAELKGLDRTTAAEGHPVELSGVVILSRPEWHDDEQKRGFGLTLQDASGSVYVSASEALGDTGSVYRGDYIPAIGDRIELRGVSGPGGFAPVILARELKKVGTGPLPDPISVRLADLLPGTFDSTRVEIEGVVRRASLDEGQSVMRLHLASHDGEFRAAVYGESSLNPKSLVDAAVRIVGICGGSFNSRGEIMNITITAQKGELEILKPPPADPFKSPPASTLGLQPFSLASPSLHRHTLRGVVTLIRPGTFCYVATPDRGFRVDTEAGARLEVGDEVIVAGFVVMADSYAKMSHGVFRRSGKGELPRPLSATRNEVLTRTVPSVVKHQSQDLDGRLVSLEGKLIRVEMRVDGVHRLYVESDGALTLATIDASVDLNGTPLPRIGSKLRLTGVSEIRLDAAWPNLQLPSPSEFTLLLRDLDDIEILTMASWWTPARLGTVLAITGVAAILLTLWNVTLQRRVRSQTALIGERIATASKLSERQRIGRELHDTLQQELAGVGMLLDNCKAHLQSPEKAKPILSMASRMLDRAQEESRSSIQDLISVSLEQGGLKRALEDLVRPLAEIGGARFKIEVTEPMPKLSNSIATTLLRVAHEAVANAGKHAHAREIGLELVATDRDIAMTVRDDGCGFDLEGQRSTGQPQFGLLLMEERSLRRRGRFSIESNPGTGTVVRVVLPLESHA